LQHFWNAIIRLYSDPHDPPSTRFHNPLGFEPLRAIPFREVILAHAGSAPVLRVHTMREDTPLSLPQTTSPSCRRANLRGDVAARADNAHHMPRSASPHTPTHFLVPNASSCVVAPPRPPHHACQLSPICSNAPTTGEAPRVGGHDTSSGDTAQNSHVLSISPPSWHATLPCAVPHLSQPKFTSGVSKWWLAMSWLFGQRVVAREAPRGAAGGDLRR